MKIASVSYAKNNLSALLRDVDRGGTIIITDHGTPVAQLAPLTASIRGIPPRAISLAERGMLVLPKRGPSLDWLKGPRPKLPPGASASRAIIEEREQGR